MTFGNPNFSHVTFRMEGASKRDQVMQIVAFVNAGFFSANLPIFVTRTQAESFIEDLERVDRSLKGSAALRPTGHGTVEILLEIGNTGQVTLTGDAEIDQNRLRFHIEADQTVLKPLRDFFVRGMSRI